MTDASATRLLFLEAFAEASIDGLFSLDADGRIAAWSRSAERIWGYQEADIAGQPAAVLFPEHLRTEMKPLIDAVADGDRVHQVETEIQRRDGMPIPIALTMSPVFNGAGEVVGAVAVARDITEVRLAQAALAEVETRLRDGEALAHWGRWLWDIGTDAVQWSDEFHEIHGIDPLEFEGTMDGYLECIHIADRGRVSAGLKTAVTSCRRFEDEYRTVRPDGEIRWVYVRGDPMLGSADVVVGLRGIGQDITDRHDRRPEGGRSNRSDS